MELWLDTAEVTAIKKASELGLLQGVTTNPTILSRVSTPAENVLEEILALFSGPVAVQVTVNDAAGMIEQAKDLIEFSNRIIVKIPVTEAGLRAIAHLRTLKIMTMGTAIFEPMQAFLAAKAGASYLAPYFSHIGEQALNVCDTMQQILTSNQLQAKLLIASLRTPIHVVYCAQRGFGMTLPPALFEECITPPDATAQALERFEKAWREAPPSELLSPERLR